MNCLHAHPRGPSALSHQPPPPATGDTHCGEVTPGLLWVPQTTRDRSLSADAGGTWALDTKQRYLQGWQLRCQALRDSVGYVPSLPPHRRHRYPRAVVHSRLLPHATHMAPVPFVFLSPNQTCPCHPPPCQSPRCHVWADSTRGPHGHSSHKPGGNQLRQAGGSSRGPRQGQC